MKKHSINSSQWLRLGQSKYEINKDGRIAKLNPDSKGRPKVLNNYVLKNNHVITLVDTTELNNILINILPNKSQQIQISKNTLAKSLTQRSALSFSQIMCLINSIHHGYYSKRIIKKLVLNHLVYIVTKMLREYNIVLHIHTNILDYLVCSHNPIRNLINQVYFDKANFDEVLNKYILIHVYKYELQNQHKLLDLLITMQGITNNNNDSHVKEYDNAHIQIQKSGIHSI